MKHEDGMLDDVQGLVHVDDSSKKLLNPSWVASQLLYQLTVGLRAVASSSG